MHSIFIRLYFPSLMHVCHISNFHLHTQKFVRFSHKRYNNYNSLILINKRVGTKVFLYFLYVMVNVNTNSECFRCCIFYFINFFRSIFKNPTRKKLWKYLSFLICLISWILSYIHTYICLISICCRRLINN